MIEWLLEFEEVHFAYPGAAEKALHGLSIRVPPRKKCVLLGRNGCGKSTFLLHANGICRPQRGVVRWRGQAFRYERKWLAEIRRKVGLLLQDPEQQFVAGTVAEDISYGLCNLGLAEAEVKRRVSDILEQFELVRFAQHPLHQLSLGQKKWVALAGVMAVEPELLLLDEPTASLDPFHEKRLLAELDRLHEAGTTILMATHDLDLALAWGEWIFVMDQGRLVLEGPPEEVFSQREVLTAIRLGVPLLAEVWLVLKETLGQTWAVPGRGMPRTVEELRRFLPASLDGTNRDAEEG
jgi:cobalt/nickel transport system ATP-binding protein